VKEVKPTPPLLVTAPKEIRKIQTLKEKAAHLNNISPLASARTG
jgi:hypothetical protein